MGRINQKHTFKEKWWRGRGRPASVETCLAAVLGCSEITVNCFTMAGMVYPADDPRCMELAKRLRPTCLQPTADYNLKHCGEGKDGNQIYKGNEVEKNLKAGTECKGYGLLRLFQELVERFDGKETGKAVDQKRLKKLTRVLGKIRGLDLWGVIGLMTGEPPDRKVRELSLEAFGLIKEMTQEDARALILSYGHAAAMDGTIFDEPTIESERAIEEAPASQTTKAQSMGTFESGRPTQTREGIEGKQNNPTIEVIESEIAPEPGVLMENIGEKSEHSEKASQSQPTWICPKEAGYKRLKGSKEKTNIHGGNDGFVASVYVIPKKYALLTVSILFVFGLSWAVNLFTPDQIIKKTLDEGPEALPLEESEGFDMNDPATVYSLAFRDYRGRKFPEAIRKVHIVLSMPDLPDYIKADCDYLLGMITTAMGLPEQALNYLNLAVYRYQEQGNDLGLFNSFTEMGHSHTLSDEPLLARESLDKALYYYEISATPGKENYLAQWYEIEFRYMLSIRDAAGALDAIRERVFNTKTENLFELGISQSSLGFALAINGELDTAIHYTEKAAKNLDGNAAELVFNEVNSLVINRILGKDVDHLYNKIMAFADHRGDFELAKLCDIAKNWDINKY